uniref:Uncharacterized protein n=1 Tax=Aegilops tauschii subsp. strangulata TaxID=200361 RepID=A0A453PCT2_AEGTS
MAHCGGGPGPAAPREASSVESHFQGLLDDDDKYRALCGAFGYLQQQEWPDLSGACYAAFGAPPPPGTSNGAGNSFSCSGSASSGGGSTKRKPDAYVDAKDDCKRPRGKQQLCDPDEAGAAAKGRPEKAKACARKKPEPAAAGQKTDYIHVRARRGQATDSHSLAERVCIDTPSLLERTINLVYICAQFDPDAHDAGEAGADQRADEVPAGAGARLRQGHRQGRHARRDHQLRPVPAEAGRVPVHEDRRLQPGGELQHRRRPLRRQADEPGVRPLHDDAADAPGAAGPVLPSDEQRYHAADATTGCRVRAGHARQQPVPGGAERAPIGGCHTGVDVSRRVRRIMPRREWSCCLGHCVSAFVQWV